MSCSIHPRFSVLLAIGLTVGTLVSLRAASDEIPPFDLQDPATSSPGTNGIETATLPDTSVSTKPIEEGTPAVSPTNALPIETQASVPLAPPPTNIIIVTNVLVAPPAPQIDLMPLVEALSDRLGSIEQSMAMQHRQFIVASEQVHWTVLKVTACFALAALLGLLLAAMIMARALNRFSETVASRLTGPPVLGSGEMMPALVSESSPSAAPQIEQVTTRFLGAVEQLERRIGELEHTTRQAVSDEAGPERSDNGGGSGTSGKNLEFSVSALHQKQYPDSATTGNGADDTETEPVDEWVLLMGKGHSLLNLGQAEEALECFARATELDANNAEVWVKHGMALEKLDRLEEAVESYDKAIAADVDMTLAYLHKGAACNRLQRYREALESYEKALKSEQKGAATVSMSTSPAE